MTRLAFVVVAVAPAACATSRVPTDAGRDAPPPTADARLIDLTDDEYLALCEWWAARHGWPEVTMVECPPRPGEGGLMYTVRAPGDCLRQRLSASEYPACELTAGAYYACDATGYDPCSGEGAPTTCLRPLECSTSTVLLGFHW